MVKNSKAMSSNKKNKIVCEKCFKQFRSKDKFKKLCPECNKKNEENKKTDEGRISNNKTF